MFCVLQAGTCLPPPFSCTLPPVPLLLHPLHLRLSSCTLYTCTLPPARSSHTFPTAFPLQHPSSYTHHTPLTHTGLSSEMEVLLGMCMGQSMKQKSTPPTPHYVHDGERVERRQERGSQGTSSEEMIRLWRKTHKGQNRPGQSIGLHLVFPLMVEDTTCL